MPPTLTNPKVFAMRYSAFFAALCLPALLHPLWAQAQPQPAVAVSHAWARATVQGQQATGAFMTLTAPVAMQLVGVSSPVAGVAEIHEMRVDNGVMHMRAISHLDLPTRKAVALKPGGHHIMLQDLKAPLKPQHPIVVTLHLKNAQGKSSFQQVNLPVSARAPQGAGDAPVAGHSHGHQH